ncbi:MAG: hypothetical protein MZV64_69765 [Ignavibacteriales bacterium]|nr:hypothetical protein [Ignavibacteriales bacterium]
MIIDVNHYFKKGRDKSILRKHPWIFSGAIESIKDINANGQTVDIKSFDGKFWVTDPILRILK